MTNHKQIIVTGAAGFIGSCMVELLNEKGLTNLILVDDFGPDEKRKNWEGKQFHSIVERQSLMNWINTNNPAISIIIHLGARTDTTEFDYTVHEALNLEYSKTLWNYAVDNQIPFIYASSAATYGAGEHGYKDDHTILDQLTPLNPYGISKNEFDKWAIRQQNQPPCWTGLKFFNVYGPNEYHKERMASVIWHSYNQIKANGSVKLFKSHKEGFKDGEQLRDFIYVKDVVSVIAWMFETMDSGKWDVKNNGIYNLGTGTARSFIDLVNATFKGLDLEPVIEFIDMPIDIRDKYQYFTQADMTKLKNAGYLTPFYSLEDGVDDYVRNYLSKEKIY